MYKSYKVLFSVGTTKGATFTPNSNTYLMETVVQAISAMQAQSLVESQYGGSNQCRVNRVQQL
jgi:hypothetical protein